MPLSLPSPAGIIGTVVTLASVPARLLRLVDGAELLLVRATTALDEVERAVGDARAATVAATAVLDEAAATSASAAVLVGEAAATSAGAAVAVEQAARSAVTAGELVTAYEPGLRQFIENLSADEVDAAIRMVDELPRLAHHLNADVMPILATLDRVGPDIHELLNVTRDLRQAIIGIPGFGMLRRRGAGAEDRSPRASAETGPDAD
jgi:hypothetical protein